MQDFDKDTKNPFGILSEVQHDMLVVPGAG